MIGYLQGEILENQDGKMLLGIGDRKNAGTVGYLVAVPQSASYGAYLVGEKLELFVYTHVREEAFDLYGFSTKFEKELFFTLLSVNGIGPKSALGILSAVEANQLIQAIMEGDQASLTRIPGIGKKTAERVVVELRDTVRKKVELGVFSAQLRVEAHSKTTQSGALRKEGVGSLNSQVVRDAKEALISLGYREQDIQQLLNRVLENSEFKPQRAEDLIRAALRQMS